MTNKKSKKQKEVLTEKEGASEILKYRRQMLVHSFLYYELGENLISDHEFDQRALKLKELQNKYGYEFNFHDFFFKDWDGSTGYHLIGISRHYEGLARSLSEYKKKKNKC